MHNLLYLSLFFCLLIACNSEPQVAQNSPDEAVRGLFEALKASDFEKAKLFATTSTQASLLDFATNLKMTSEEEKKALLAPFQMPISKVTCTELEGTMTCTLYCTEGDIVVQMVEQDKKWFAQMEFVF